MIETIMEFLYSFSFISDRPWKCRNGHDYVDIPGKPDDWDHNYDWEQECTRCGKKW